MVYNRETQEFASSSNLLFNTCEAESVILKLNNEDLEKKLADMQAAVKQITEQRDVLIKEVQNEKSSNEFYTKKLTNIMEMCKNGIQMMYELSSVTSDVLKAANSAIENGESSKKASRNKTYAVRPMISGHVISKPTIRLSRVTDLQANTGTRFPRKRQALGTNQAETSSTEETNGQDYLLDMEIQQFSHNDGNLYSSSSSSSASYSGSSLQNASVIQEAQAAFERNSRNLSVRIDHLRSNILKNFKLNTSLYSSSPSQESQSAATPKESETTESSAKVKPIPVKPTSPKRSAVKRKVTETVKISSPKVMLRRLPMSKTTKQSENEKQAKQKSPKKMSPKVQSKSVANTLVEAKRKPIAKKVASKAKSKPKTAKKTTVKKTQRPKTKKTIETKTRRARKVKLLVL